jgi:hypothetical protein
LYGIRTEQVCSQFSEVSCKIKGVDSSPLYSSSWIIAIEITLFWLSLKAITVLSSQNFSALRLRREEITCRLFLIL